MRKRGFREFDKVIHYYEPLVDDKRHKVPVKIKTTNGESVTFYTEHFRDENERVIKNGFDNLKDCYEWIEEQLEEMPGVEWIPKIYINVKGKSFATMESESNSYDGATLMSVDVGIVATAIELGMSDDGKTYRRAAGRPKTKRQFTKNIGYGLEKDWWKADDDDDAGEPYSRALIDDTEKNRELLVAFAVRFDELRDMFFKAFAHDNASAFLNRAAGRLLLNAMSSEAKRK